jgi:hypothetical protein
MLYHSGYKKTAGGISITIFIRGYRASTTRTNLAKKIQVGEPTTPPLNVVRSNAVGHFNWLVRQETECQLHPPHRLPQETNNSLSPALAAHVRRSVVLGARGMDNVDQTKRQK